MKPAVLSCWWSTVAAVSAAASTAAYADVRFHQPEKGSPLVLPHDEGHAAAQVEPQRLRHVRSSADGAAHHHVESRQERRHRRQRRTRALRRTQRLAADGEEHARDLVRDSLTSADDVKETELPVPVVLELYETSGFLSAMAGDELAFGLSRYLYFTLQRHLATDQRTRREFELLLDLVPVLTFVSGTVIENSNAVLPLAEQSPSTRIQARQGDGDGDGGDREAIVQQVNRDGIDGRNINATDTAQDQGGSITGSRLQFEVSIQWTSPGEDGEGLDSIDGSSIVTTSTKNLFQDLVEQALRGDLDNYNQTESSVSRRSGQGQPSQNLLSNLTLSNIDELSKVTTVLYFPPTAAPTAVPIVTDAPTAAPASGGDSNQPPTATVAGANRDIPQLSKDKTQAFWPVLIVSLGVFVLTAIWIAFRRRQGVNLDDLASLDTEGDDGYRGSKRRKRAKVDHQSNHVANARQVDREHSFVLRNAVTGSEPPPLLYSQEAVAAVASPHRETPSDGRNNRKYKYDRAMDGVHIPSANEVVLMADGTHIHHGQHSPSRSATASPTLTQPQITTLNEGYRTAPMPLELASDIDSDSHHSSSYGSVGRKKLNVGKDNLQRGNSRRGSNMTAGSSTKRKAVASNTLKWEEEWQKMGSTPQQGTTTAPAAATLGDDISNYSNSDTTASSNDALLAPSHNGTGLFCPYSTSTNLLGGEDVTGITESGLDGLS